MRKTPRLLLLLLVVTLGAGACQKKSFKLTGDETDEEAINKCIALSEKKKYEQAVECLEIFKSRFPDSTYALDAELNIADAYFRKKDWVLAAETYALSPGSIRPAPNWITLTTEPAWPMKSNCPSRSTATSRS